MEMRRIWHALGSAPDRCSMDPATDVASHRLSAGTPSHEDHSIATLNPDWKKILKCLSMPYL